MSDVMAVVDKDTFGWHDKNEGPLSAGSGPLKWNDYESKHPFLDDYLDDGDRIFLVTARPGGRLWLIAVYEDVYRGKRGWYARRPNRTKILDITTLIPQLKFHTGKGLTTNGARLGNSLQSPRKLTANDIRLLEKALAKRGQNLAPPKITPLDDPSEVEEGIRLTREVTRLSRDPLVVEKRLRLDGNTCQHCGFVVSTSTFPTLRGMSRVVNVHHIRPLKDGKRKTKVADLLTLCPTCHAVAYAVARSLGQHIVSLALLKKHFRR